MFNIGDYVTGKDRSYKRSIYKVVQFIDSETFRLQFIALSGRLGTDKDMNDRPIDTFRLATQAEVHEELGCALGYNLIGFVRELLLTRSSQEQQ
jgi:hypothetical protein